jgi:hypothetical protein
MLNLVASVMVAGSSPVSGFFWAPMKAHSTRGVPQPLTGSNPAKLLSCAEFIDSDAHDLILAFPNRHLTPGPMWSPMGAFPCTDFRPVLSSREEMWNYTKR